MTPPPPPAPLNFDDLSRRLSKGFDQMKQFASEKIGTAESVTPFPPAYIHLDDKIDRVRTVFDGLLRVTMQMHASDNYQAAWSDTLKDTMGQLHHRLERLRGRPSGSDSSTGNVADDGDHGDGNNRVIPATIQAATAEICFEGAEVLSADRSPFSLADAPAANVLQKYGHVQRKLSEAREEFNRTVQRKFIEPFGTYTGAYANATRARRNATRVRLELDAAKAKLLAIRGVRPAQVQADVELLEKEFGAACDEAIAEMKMFIQYTEATHCVEALIQAQQTYHRKAAEILAALN